MNTTKIWIRIPRKQALKVLRKLDAVRARPKFHRVGEEAEITIDARFMTVQEAMMVMYDVVPEGTEIFVS